MRGCRPASPRACWLWEGEGGGSILAAPGNKLPLTRARTTEHTEKRPAVHHSVGDGKYLKWRPHGNPPRDQYGSLTYMARRGKGTLRKRQRAARICDATAPSLPGQAPGAVFTGGGKRRAFSARSTGNCTGGWQKTGGIRPRFWLILPASSRDFRMLNEQDPHLEPFLWKISEDSPHLKQIPDKFRRTHCNPVTDVVPSEKPGLARRAPLWPGEIVPVRA